MAAKHRKTNQTIPDPAASPARKARAPKKVKPKGKKKRRVWLYVLVAVLLVAVAAGAAGFYLIGCQRIKRTLSGFDFGLTIPERRVYCPIDGVQLPNDLNIKRRPLLVKVENLSDARPQSGLDKADIVYEMVAEGGITRFAVVYLCKDAEEIGPVRSARLQDGDLVREYDAIFAHCGGSDAWMDSSKAGIADLDQFSYDDAYWRSDERDAPHNLYTATKRLRDAAQAAGFERPVTIKGHLFKKDAPGKTSATAIRIPYSAACDVEYTYDAKTNRYHRSVAGSPQTDKVTGAQLSPKNVIVQYVNYSYAGDGEDYGMGGNRMMELVGQGRAQVFIDGEVIEGTWNKAGLTEPTVFLDQAGQEIKFNRGQFWVSIVPDSYTVEVVGATPAQTP